MSKTVVVIDYMSFRSLFPLQRIHVSSPFFFLDTSHMSCM